MSYQRTIRLQNNTCIAYTLAAAWMLFQFASASADELAAKVLWRTFLEESSCEIVCCDPQQRQLFVTTAQGINQLDALTGNRVRSIAAPKNFHSTSVAWSQGKIAVAWAADDKHQRGKIGFYDAKSCQELATFSAGFLPDMVTFSPHGKYLLAANEGEPTDDYQFDPQASITVLDLSQGLASADLHEVGFQQFNPQRDKLREQGVLLTGPSSTHPDGQATVAEDLEPEFIAIGPNSKRAWITLQENNAVAELDLEHARIASIHPWGLKNFRHLINPSDHSETTGLDASDVDGGSKVRHWPVLGFYQPDGIAVFEEGWTTYLLTANEGETRDYLQYSDHCPATELGKYGLALDRSLDARYFLHPSQLGHLHVSKVSGDMDNDGDLDALHCFGARSFSVWQINAKGVPQLAYDSGVDFEQITAHEAADRFNADSSPDSLPDQRSSKRGPEPESIVIGQVGKHRLAMVGLERTGGVMIYDLSLPTYPKFLKYLPPLHEDGLMDCGPEGLVLIPAKSSPTGKPLLIICNEKSGTTTAYEFEWEI